MPAQRHFPQAEADCIIWLNLYAAKLVKYGHQGVAIETRINGGEWGLLGHYTQKPVYDDRPLAVPGTP